jgi:hypothetical protein
MDQHFTEVSEEKTDMIQLDGLQMLPDIHM